VRASGGLGFLRLAGVQTSEEHEGGEFWVMGEEVLTRASAEGDQWNGIMYTLRRLKKLGWYFLFSV
jgi:hypothetical protein